MALKGSAFGVNQQIASLEIAKNPEGSSRKASLLHQTKTEYGGG